MPEPQSTQEILNKIRRGDINAFYEFRNLIKQKYDDLDHIIAYGTYELMSTDFNEKDIDLFKSFAIQMNNNHSYLEQNALKGLASHLEAIAIESVAFQQNGESINPEDIVASRNLLYSKNKDTIIKLSTQEISENNFVIDALERYAALAQHETNLLFLVNQNKPENTALNKAIHRKLLRIDTEEDSNPINKAATENKLLSIEIKKWELMRKIYQYETEHSLSDDQKKIIYSMQNALNGTAANEELDILSKKQSDSAFQSIINFFVQLYNQIFHSETVAEFKAIKKEYKILIQESSPEEKPTISQTGPR